MAFVLNRSIRSGHECKLFQKFPCRSVASRYNDLGSVGKIEISDLGEYFSNVFDMSLHGVCVSFAVAYSGLSRPNSLIRSSSNNFAIFFSIAERLNFMSYIRAIL